MSADSAGICYTYHELSACSEALLSDEIDRAIRQYRLDLEALGVPADRIAVAVRRLEREAWDVCIEAFMQGSVAAAKTKANAAHAQHST